MSAGIILLGAAVPAVLCAGTYVVIGGMCSKAFGERPDKNKARYTYMFEHYAADYPRREVSFPGTAGELHGFIYGEKNEKALVVVCHGIGAFHEGLVEAVTG